MAKLGTQNTQIAIDLLMRERKQLGPGHAGRRQRRQLTAKKENLGDQHHHLLIFFDGGEAQGQRTRGRRWWNRGGGGRTIGRGWTPSCLQEIPNSSNGPD
jgi:hypothetical protein